ncbi:hypothetical protein VULLAG_LOCUS18384 [Vulpes lagopus]
MPWRLFLACGEDAAPHASPDAELRAPLQLHWPTGPLRTLHSGTRMALSDSLCHSDSPVGQVEGILLPPSDSDLVPKTVRTRIW